jgi:acyl-CoA synthetase (NDP forming)
MGFDATPFRVWSPQLTARYLEERGIPSYPYAPERAVSALAALHRWSGYAGLLEE